MMLPQNHLKREAKRIESQQRDEVGQVATSITNERTASDASQVTKVDQQHHPQNN